MVNHIRQDHARLLLPCKDRPRLLKGLDRAAWT